MVTLLYHDSKSVGASSGGSDTSLNTDLFFFLNFVWRYVDRTSDNMLYCLALASVQLYCIQVNRTFFFLITLGFCQWDGSVRSASLCLLQKGNY